MWTYRLARYLLLSIALLPGFGLSGSEARADEQDAPSPTAVPYRIQPGDVLLISVWKESDLQGETLVRPDGGLSFPLAGEIQASGRSVEEVRAVIGARIQKYIPEALVTVAVKTIGGNHIYVLGKVNRPGETPIRR